MRARIAELVRALRRAGVAVSVAEAMAAPERYLAIFIVFRLQWIFFYKEISERLALFLTRFQ